MVHVFWQKALTQQSQGLGLFCIVGNCFRPTDGYSRVLVLGEVELLFLKLGRAFAYGRQAHQGICLEAVDFFAF